ncbi:MAG: proline iminopeptidase [Frankiaceae bacterium]|jgi:pimeloyl-ACP methyl ester carboxylesterase|nr:proline iminopeptidase [Frankiaceae bacterium]
MSGAGVVQTRDGLRLAYRLVGSGPPLVCQPGGPGRAATYLRDLGGLNDGRTLVLLDAIGTGASDRPDDPQRLGYQHLADDLEDVREHLGLATMDLLGHSAGTVVAQVYAAAHPERINSLVLVTPPGWLQGTRPEDVPAIVNARRGEPHLAEALAAWDAWDTAPESEHRRLEIAARPLFYGPWNDVTAAHAAGADSEMDAVAEAHFTPPPGTVDDAAIVAALMSVTAPVLVVAGSVDAGPGVKAAYAVAESFPNATVEVLDGLGHFPWVEQPAAFTPVVQAFLGGLPS